MGKENQKVKGVDAHRTAGATAPPERIASPPADAGGTPLGKLTKSQAAFREDICPETGVVTGFELNAKRREYVQVVDKDAAVSEARTARFALQKSSRSLLFDKPTPREGDWRVCGCHLRRISEDVAVCYAPSIERAHYGNLMVCGSVWTCPVCSAKISERRKNEIKVAVDMHKAAGGGLYMLTLTHAHTRQSDLRQMLLGMRAAMAGMREQRRYKNLMRDIDQVGHIRALEVTYGDANGWHPHMHEGLFVSKELTERERRRVQGVIFNIWKLQCEKHGLGTPNRKNGVNLIRMDSAAEYLAKFGKEQKWGAASELSKQHSKKGRGERMSPFDILRRYEAGETRFGPLFIEYANAFFGSQQIVWSRGLKAMFQIEDKSDEQLATEQAEDARQIHKITSDEWRLVLSQPSDRRGVILDLAERGGSEAVQSFIDGLRSTPSGEILSFLDAVQAGKPRKVAKFDIDTPVPAPSRVGGSSEQAPVPEFALAIQPKPLTAKTRTLRYWEAFLRRGGSLANSS